MRYLYFLLILVFVTGCAHGRLRLVKVDKKGGTEVLASSEDDTRTARSSKKEREIVVPNETVSVQESIVVAPIVTSQSNENVADPFALDETETVSPSSSSDAIDEEEVEPSKSYKLKQALAAEKDARKARTSFIWSLAMLFCIFLPFVPLFSFIPFVVGSIRLWRANRSDYITPEGERNEHSARIMQFIYAALIVALTIAIVVILLI